MFSCTADFQVNTFWHKSRLGRKQIWGAWPVCWAAQLNMPNCAFRRVFSAPSLVHFKWRCICDWHSRCWHKAVSGSQEWSREFVSGASSTSRKSVHLKDRRMNAIHQALRYCVSLTDIFCASQVQAMQTSLNVILLGFFSCGVCLRYMMWVERREREKWPHFWNNQKSPKLFRILGDVIHACLSGGWWFFSEEAGKLIRLYWSNNEDLNLLLLLFMSK